MKLSEFKSRAAREERDDWVRSIPDLPGLELHVKSIECLAFRNARQRLANRRPADEKDLRADPATEFAEMGELLAATVLIDWKGVEDEAGAAIPYSKEKAVELLTDPALRPLQDAVRYAAMTVAIGS